MRQNPVHFHDELSSQKLDAIRRQQMYGVSEGDTEERSAFLTYLLTQKSLTAEEANLHAVDLMTGGVETVCASFCLTVVRLLEIR